MHKVYGNGYKVYGGSINSGAVERLGAFHEDLRWP